MEYKYSVFESDCRNKSGNQRQLCRTVNLFVLYHFYTARFIKRREFDRRNGRFGGERYIYRNGGFNGFDLCFERLSVGRNYLEITHKPEAAELTVFCGAMVGASLGFLWYNSPPAEVFMGDVGSLAIGGALGTVAILTKQEFLLPFIGGVFILEAVSVMLQVGFFKFTKRQAESAKEFSNKHRSTIIFRWQVGRNRRLFSDL